MSWAQYKEDEKQKELEKKNAPKRNYGLTSPISLAGPTPYDLKCTEALIELLKAFDAFESDEEFKHRISVLSKLYSLVRKWIRDITLTRQLPDEFAEEAGGAMYTFGSFRLGVSFPVNYLHAYACVSRNLTLTILHTKGFNWQWLKMIDKLR